LEGETDVSEEHITFIFKKEELGFVSPSAGLLLGLVLIPEDGGDIFLRNALKRQYSL
jgi:hypothetical protein